VRRLLLVNALIFAVLAAAVALAYYSFSYSTGSRERELELMKDLAEEKVLNIESLIDETDTKLFKEVQPTQLANLDGLVKTTGAAVASVFVLDDQLQMVPSGVWVKPTDCNPKKEDCAQRDLEFRDWFLSRVVQQLNLPKHAGACTPLACTRRHVLFQAKGTPYLFSFVKKQAGDRTFFVVVQDDINYLVGVLFPQFFPSRSSRLYEVVDERGDLRFGLPFIGGLVVEVPFSETVDGWVLRVSDRTDTESKLRQQRAAQSILIGGAVAVIAFGLGFLALAIRRERRANELKSDFISNVSHELKTPLSLISMFGEMLASGRTKSPEQATEYAEIIWRESVRLGRLIDNVLDFAKIERGMGVYEFAETDVGDVVARAIELSQRRLAAANMRLDAEIEPDLPPIELDANAFTLAVMNLIDNAIKYAADTKHVELALRRQDDRIVLSVRDFGPGIAPDEQEQIFERFYRARAVRLKPIRGSGIGLALVRHIARAHRGDVSVASEPGKGATFTMWLPIR
jgi:two-component system phosphate regulon sensor histidine kinase PhoR